MSRILICVAAFEPSLILGGPAAVAADHARELAARGHQVTVLTTNLTSLRPVRRHALTIAERDGFRIEYLDARVPYPHFSAVLVPRLRRWLRTNLAQFDVAHIHFAREPFTLTCAELARRAGKPHVLQTHGMLHRAAPQHRIIDRLFTRRALRNASAVLALQSVEEGQLRRIEPAAKIVRLANGMPVPGDGPRWSAGRLEAPARVVFLARLSPIKGLRDLVEAAAILSRQGLAARYEIIGPDGGELAAAQQRVAELGLADAFDFMGALPRAQALLRLRDAAVHAQPSTWECFSMTTLEALSFGVPCVVTTGNELWQELQAEGAAMVVEPGTATFAAGLGTLLRDRVLATNLSQRGQAWLRKRCAIEVVIGELEAAYARAIGG